MTKIILTVREKTLDAAAAAVGHAPAAVDGFELRLDGLDRAEIDLASFRRLSPKPMILTRRSGSGHDGIVDVAHIERAIAAGFDLVDVEYGEGFDRNAIEPFRDRALLSYHDFDATPELDPLVEAMRAVGCAQTKIAATPQSFRDNQRLLEILAIHNPVQPWYEPSFTLPNVTLLGMGSRGLYSRLLAPLFGSAFVFVSSDHAGPAAPGQLSISRLLTIYGQRPRFTRPRTLFAVVGNPACHSLSPDIHNARFFSAAIPAAYSIIETDSFEDAVWPFAAGAKLAPMGLSITAPFKEEAFRFAMSSEATVGPNALESGAVNTLIRRGGGERPEILAVNTDVDAFEAALSGCDSSALAVLVGAGGTARAALVALRRGGFDVRLVNRTEEKGSALAAEFSARMIAAGDLEHLAAATVVNTLPPGAEFSIPDSLISKLRNYVAAAYGGPDENADRVRLKGGSVFSGLDLLYAQAERQSSLFIEAAREEIARQEAERRTSSN